MKTELCVQLVQKSAKSTKEKMDHGKEYGNSTEGQKLHGCKSSFLSTFADCWLLAWLVGWVTKGLGLAGWVAE